MAIRRSIMLLAVAVFSTVVVTLEPVPTTAADTAGPPASAGPASRPEASSVVPTSQPTSQPANETELLALILKTYVRDQFGPNRRNPVAVAEMTSSTFSPAVREDADSRARSKRFITNELKQAGHNVGPLVDKLFELNAKSVRLTVKSSPADGYEIKDNPGMPWVRVSLAAWDSKAGLVLVYIGHMTAPLAGAGSLHLYKLDNGQLKQLTAVMLWIS